MRVAQLPLDDPRAKRGRNAKARGAEAERDIARRMGGRRFPADSGGKCDVDHPTHAIQVKSGATVTTEALRVGLAQAQVGALGTSKLPCVVLVDRRAARNRRYIVFDLDEYCAWNGFPQEDPMPEVDTFGNPAFVVEIQGA